MMPGDERLRDGNITRVRYVFDVSDTGRRENSRSPFVWQTNDANEDAVHAMLEKEYGLDEDKLKALRDAYLQ